MKPKYIVFQFIFFLMFQHHLCFFYALNAQENDERVEVASERIRLSYVDPLRCIDLLKLYGVNVGSPSQAVDQNKLPVVVPMPETKFHETVPDHTKVFPKTETDPINEILLFFDEQKPEATGRVRRIIREQIDLPARKIMIEAMVLEISSQALDELGVQWDLNPDRTGDGNFIKQKGIFNYLL